MTNHPSRPRYTTMTQKERNHLQRWRTVRAGLALVTIVRCPNCDARGGVHVDLETREVVWCYTCGWWAGMRDRWGRLLTTPHTSRTRRATIAGLSLRELERLVGTKGDAVG